jgi:signal transduction histidine kinase
MNRATYTDTLDSSSRVIRDRFRRFSRLDPVGPVVAGHALLLTALGSVERTGDMLALAAAVLGWRGVLTFVANRADRTARHRSMFAREFGSLVLVGVMMGLDGGTDSPIFFSMLIVLVWAAAMNPLNRFVSIGIASLVVYLAVILLVPDVTVASLGRFGVFVFFVGLLAWARALSDFWERDSRRSKELAAEILTRVPTGFVLFDSVDLACLFANPVATDLGLDQPELRRLSRYGAPNGTITFYELLTSVTTSGEALAPTLYVMSTGEPRETFLRITVTPRRVADDKRLLLMVSAEDVSAQVAAGEQQRRFLESANHQFRTPLSPILAYSTLIARQELGSDDLKEAGETIRKAAIRIETLLERISSLLRLQRRHHRELHSIEVHDLFENHVFDLAPQLRDHIDVTADDNLALRCEPAPLASAILELAVNSQQHGVPPITVTAHSHNDTVSIRIYDGGPGPNLDPDTPLDLTWGAIAHPEQMPPEMGDRLGLSYAVTLTQTAGGALHYERNQTSWAFTLEFPVAHTQPVSA